MSENDIEFLVFTDFNSIVCWTCRVSRFNFKICFWTE